VLLNAPPIRKGRRYYLSAADVKGTLAPLLAPGTCFSPNSIKTVLLDPGHGGDDSGAVGSLDNMEKEIVLDIAERTRDLLKAHGTEVILTRDQDTTLPLLSRTERAGVCNADLFVSIHLNASGNRAASGVETYLVPAAGFPSSASSAGPSDACPGNHFDALNMRLAYSVHKEVLARTRAADRGIRRARFAVLRTAPCPAILLECGFLSNREEELRIMNGEHRQAIAEGIAAGIRDLMRSR